MIHAFGNSHAHFFTGENPGQTGISRVKNPIFQSYSTVLGACTAWKFKEKYWPELKNYLNNYVDIKKDKLMLVVGEVDCRVHIPKQSEEQNRTTADIVEECVYKLFDAYRILRQKGYSLIAWGGHPTTNDGPIYEKEKIIYGQPALRRRVVKEWDTTMQSYAQEAGIPYLSAIPLLLNKDGSTKMEYYTDYCHLNHKLLFRDIVKLFKHYE